jgi:hypothetical protein
VWDTLTGVQVAGGVNVVKGGMLGVQVAGFANVTTQNCDGAQVSGGCNITVKDVRKSQITGGMNYGRNVSGAQVAGVLNVASGTVEGGQIAGAMNCARQVTGGQVAGVLNVVVDTVKGGQIGVLNFARICEGGQVGIFNFSDTIMGSSVGLLSFAWRGYHRFDVSTTDVLPLTLAFRTGTRHFHNILSWSPPVDAEERWGFAYGVGTELRVGKHGAMDIDLTVEHVNERKRFIYATNLLTRFSAQYTYTIGRHFLLSAGPSFNLHTSDWRKPATGDFNSSIAPRNALFEQFDGNTRLQGWLGFRAGLGVRF